MQDSYTFSPVAVMKSCFKAKFGIPRQPGLVPEAKGTIEFIPPFNQPNVVRGLEAFSHVWVLFVFDRNIRENWKATVRPPRLGGDRRVGVFASRSPFRPSPIGLSVLKLNEVVCRNGRVYLEVEGMDILDGTPILDVKPYIPYCDSIPDAIGGYADSEPPVQLEVRFTEEAGEKCRLLENGIPGFRPLVEKLLRTNPRPAYQDELGRKYGIFLYGYEVEFTVDGDVALVLDIRDAREATAGGYSHE